jgi:hypothetical protein
LAKDAADGVVAFALADPEAVPGIELELPVPEVPGVLGVTVPGRLMGVEGDEPAGVQEPQTRLTLSKASATAISVTFAVIVDVALLYVKPLTSQYVC